MISYKTHIRYPTPAAVEQLPQASPNLKRIARCRVHELGPYSDRSNAWKAVNIYSRVTGRDRRNLAVIEVDGKFRIVERPR